MNMRCARLADGLGSDKGSKVTYAMRTRLADGLGPGTRLVRMCVCVCVIMASQIFEIWIVIF